MTSPPPTPPAPDSGDARDFGDVTLLLARLGDADDSAARELYPLVYDELRAIAARCFRDQHAHTLQPTALVHEAWFKIAAPGSVNVNDRAHFFALAARAMRQVLVDHARGAQREKRGGDRERVTLDGQAVTPSFDTLDVLALDGALARLAAQSEFKAKLVELRFFGGLSVDEVAEVLKTSPSTVDREWRFARAWLATELDGRASA